MPVQISEILQIIFDLLSSPLALHCGISRRWSCSYHQNCPNFDSRTNFLCIVGNWRLNFAVVLKIIDGSKWRNNNRGFNFLGITLLESRDKASNFIAKAPIPCVIAYQNSYDKLWLLCYLVPSRFHWVTASWGSTPKERQDRGYFQSGNKDEPRDRADTGVF